MSDSVYKKYHTKTLYPNSMSMERKKGWMRNRSQEQESTKSEKRMKEKERKGK